MLSFNMREGFQRQVLSPGNQVSECHGAEFSLRNQQIWVPIQNLVSEPDEDTRSRLNQKCGLHCCGRLLSLNKC